MPDCNEVLQKVSELLDKLNTVPTPNNGLLSKMSVFLKHPIIVTVIGGLLVSGGSNYVVKKYQLREKQSDALMKLENEMPRSMDIAKKLALINTILEGQKCAYNKDKVLTRPYVFGLTGKTCGEAETIFVNYQDVYNKHPPGAPLARIRALFSSESIDNGSKNIHTLLEALSVSIEDNCIFTIIDQLNDIYSELVNLTLQEIDGKIIKNTPQIFDISRSLRHCNKDIICKIPSVKQTPAMNNVCTN